MALSGRHHQKYLKAIPDTEWQLRGRNGWNIAIYGWGGYRKKNGRNIVIYD